MVTSINHRESSIKLSTLNFKATLGPVNCGVVYPESALLSIMNPYIINLFL